MEEAKVKPLTRRQQEALEFIESFISKKGYSPTMREISEGIGVKSSGDGHRIVQRLKEAGFIKYDPGSPRSIKLVGSDWNIEKLREEVAQLRAENAELKRRLPQEEVTDAGHDALDNGDL